MSWLYWAPKSRTTTRSWVGTRPSTAGAPRGRSSGRPGPAAPRPSDPAVRTAILPPLPHALRELDRLALGHESRRDDDLGLLHLPDRARAAHPHGRPQGLHRFCDPSSTRAGPKTMSRRVPVVPTAIRVPRGRAAWGVAIPQWYPRPGASSARARSDPSITASAPQAMALAISPPTVIPPSATMGTWRPVRRSYSARAAATSTIAVAWGTPTPRTFRLVQAAPGPTPTKTAATPASRSWSAAS